MKTPIGVPVVTCRPARLVDHDAGEDARLVRLPALGGEARRARPAAVEIGLDVGRVERNRGGQPSTTQPIPGPVALAEGGDAEEMAERVVRHGRT